MKKVVINGKEVNVHDQFEYFQPNIHVDGDCVIRALCKVTGWEWKKAYCFAFISTIKEQFMPNCKEGERIVYKKQELTPEQESFFREAGKKIDYALALLLEGHSPEQIREAKVNLTKDPKQLTLAIQVELPTT